MARMRGQRRFSPDTEKLQEAWEGTAGDQGFSLLDPAEPEVRNSPVKRNCDVARGKGEEREKEN